MLYNSEYCFGKRSNQKSIKDGLGGPMVSESRLWNSKKGPSISRRKIWRLLRSKKKLYRIAKKSGLRLELKNIKKLKDKASRKHYNSSSNSSREYSDSY